MLKIKSTKTLEVYHDEGQVFIQFEVDGDNDFIVDTVQLYVKLTPKSVSTCIELRNEKAHEFVMNVPDFVEAIETEIASYRIESAQARCAL